ncbi:hypothetical protein K502DRAFT_364035 [Neoconidiobolus thromboides FSU 785]|nr:hypothetical protein K502DRAFT_364035 [Neoconidiobolus thromboides FSU 785]
MSNKWDFVKRDLYKSYTFLHYSLIIIIYLLDCNLLNLILKWCFTLIFLKIPISKNLKLSFLYLFIINFYSIILHLTSNITPGIIIDFIGQESNLALLLITDLNSLIIQILCLFIYLQAEFYKEPEEPERDNYNLILTNFNFNDTLKKHWSYDIITEADELDNQSTDNEDNFESNV